MGGQKNPIRDELEDAEVLQLLGKMSTAEAFAISFCLEMLQYEQTERARCAFISTRSIETDVVLMGGIPDRINPEVFIKCVIELERRYKIGIDVGEPRGRIEQGEWDDTTPVEDRFDVLHTFILKLSVVRTFADDGYVRT